MSKRYAFIHGDPWVCCDRCGFDYRYSETLKEWTGLRVCRACWEPRHPQEFVRGVVDRRAVKDARPEPPDVGIAQSETYEESAAGWAGSVVGAIIRPNWGSWFVDGWFTPDGWFYHINPVLYIYPGGIGDGVIYTIPLDHYSLPIWRPGGKVSCSMEWACDPDGYALVTPQYQITTDLSTWGPWTDYTAPFVADIYQIRWRLYLTEVNTPYTLVIDTFSYQIERDP